MFKNNRFRQSLWKILLLFPSNFLYSSQSLASSPWIAYHTALSTHPLWTKACTSAAIMSLSDAVCQRLEHAQVLQGGPSYPADQNAVDSAAFRQDQVNHIIKDTKFQNHHDMMRTRDVALTGLLWGGPLSHAWYSTLERIMKNTTAIHQNKKVLGLAIRLTLDAFLFSPFAIFGYLIVRSLLAGQDFTMIRKKLAWKYKGAVYSAWKFRPTANIINFLFVPLPYRVLYSNLVSLIWSGYLSHMNSKQMTQGGGDPPSSASQSGSVLTCRNA